MRIPSGARVGLIAFLALGTALGGAMPAIGQDEPSGQVNVLSWRYADPSQVGQLHTRLAEEFNASQDRITVVPQPVPYPDLLTRVVNAVLSGSPPEMMAINPGLLPSVVQYLEPLDAYWEKEGAEFEAAFDPAAVALVTYNGNKWGVPIELSTTDGLFYNKQILEEAGVDPEEAVKSWDSFRAALQKIKDAGRTPMLFEGKDASRMDRHWSWYVAGGADLSDPARYTEQMCNADAAATFEFLTNLHLDGYVPNPAGIGYAETTRQFPAGGIGFYTDGPWGPVTYAASNPDFPNVLGYTSMPPRVEGGQLGANMDGLMFVIPKGSKNPDAAWEFIKHMASPESQARQAENGNLPTRLAVRDQPVVADSPILSYFGDVIGQWGYPRPRSENNAEFRQIFITAYQAAVTRQMSAAEAHADACEKLANI